MSEADTPNNQPLPEPTASMDDSAAELPNETGTSENPQLVNLTELPTFKDFVQQSRQEQTSELVRVTTASSTAPDTPDDIEDSGTKTLDASEPERTKDADWFALAQKMRQRNRRLLEQVAKLRQALKENQETLHSQQIRGREKETLLAQRAEEFNILQEQLGRLFQALESSHQAAQRQQILIETLSDQLQSSQERLAQLERECAFTQQRYNEQSHQLLQSANTCRELKTRLHRQQRQTLQFKVALQKSLEMQSPSKVAQKQQLHHNTGIAPQSLIHKRQPIQPWSAEPVLAEDTSDLDTIWNRPVQLDPLLADYSSQSGLFEVKPIEETELLSTVDTSDPAETLIENSGSMSPVAPDSVSKPSPQDLVEPLSTELTVAKPEASELAELLGSEFFSSSQDGADTELELEQQLLAEMTSLAEASGLSEFQSDWSNTQVPLTPESGTNLDESDVPALYIGDVQETHSPEYFIELDSMTQTPSDDLWGASANHEPAYSNEVVLPQSNWPSPVLYPLRPPKKRKSLAAIELPSFPRHRDT